MAGCRTLARPIARSGVGLHSGQGTRVRLVPEPNGDRGRYFVRVDLPGQPEIPARIERMRATQLSTELASSGGGATVRTVEHLLAALAGCGVSAVRLEIDGGEVPLLDGSAAPWVDAIVEAGFTDSPPAGGGAIAPASDPIHEPIWVRDGDAVVAALPSSVLRFSYGIEFAEPAIGNQWHTWTPPGPGFSADAIADFATEIAPARTFGLAHQVEQLRQAGLILGGSLDNALVCDGDRWLNPPLRFSNEPARHKILDLVGDLSLLGTIPTAHYLAHRASHRLHGQLAQILTSRSSIARPASP